VIVMRQPWASRSTSTVRPASPRALAFERLAPSRLEDETETELW